METTRGPVQELLHGKYRILHEVGQGGMAVVYKGVDVALDREVAIKVLHPHLASRTDSRIRLQREARAVAKLHHPNIVEIYDYSGIESDKSFIVTEYIRGETLKDFADRHEPKLPEIGAMVVYVIAGAVAHAHDAGIIHRDIKPENIMIRDDGRLKLMDFGIAQVAELSAMTVTGALVGSPAHMSPEHVEGRVLDWRADVFSLGTLLYSLCTGRLPFESPSPHALLRQILEARYDDPRMHNGAISKRLHGVIVRCLKREPDERYDSAAALREELGAYLSELGFTDPAVALAEYFENPTEVEAAFTKRVVERLMSKAKDHASAGRVPMALEHYNQVLALEGNREDALEEVQRLSSSRQRRTIARRAVAVALGLAAAVGLVFVLMEDAPLSSDAGSPVAVEEPVPSPSAVPEKVAPAELPESAAPAVAEVAPVVVPAPVEGLRRDREDFHLVRNDRRIAEPTPAAVVALAPGQAEVVAEAKVPKPPIVKKPPIVNRPGGSADVEPRPTGVQVKLVALHGGALEFQGQRYERGETSSKLLQPGTYSVRVYYLDCGACISKTHTFTVGPKTPEVLKFRADFKDASLVVNGTPGATVKVAEKNGKVGAPIAFQMSQPTRRVNITVSKEGFQAKTVSATLETGAVVEKSVSLDPL
ncbi:MAG: serine/threonine protein kinase [Myxococcales bacterium]|nr:serine/threonine protein kinase [Myxococcales bacterium]